MTTTYVKFKFRRDTETNLGSVVLAEGEPGFATDTNTLKIGNGVDTWNNLHVTNQVNLTTDNDNLTIIQTNPTGNNFTFDVNRPGYTIKLLNVTSTGGPGSVPFIGPNPNPQDITNNYAGNNYLGYITVPTGVTSYLLVNNEGEYLTVGGNYVQFKVANSGGSLVVLQYNPGIFLGGSYDQVGSTITDTNVHEFVYIGGNIKWIQLY